METIEVSREDYEFLKDLQHELLTQANDGNADPLYWGVMERKETGVPNGCGEPYIYIGDGYYDTLENVIDLIEEAIGDDEKKRKEWDEETDKTDMDEVAEFYNYITDSNDAYIIYIKEQDVLSENTGAFLTKRACKEYIEKYGYNHTKPRTYAMTAYRNYEYERLLNILKTMKLC